MMFCRVTPLCSQLWTALKECHVQVYYTGDVMIGQSKQEVIYCRQLNPWFSPSFPDEIVM